MAPKDPSTFVKVGKRKVDVTSEDKEAGKRLKNWFSSIKADSTSESSVNNASSSTSRPVSTMLDDLEKSDSSNVYTRLFQGSNDITNSKEDLDSVFIDQEKQKYIPVTIKSDLISICKNIRPSFIFLPHKAPKREIKQGEDAIIKSTIQMIQIF